MDSWLSFHSGFLLLVFLILLVSVQVPVSLCSYDWYSSCNNRFNCGDNITDVGYPFWGDGRPDGCGNPDLKLNCVHNITSIKIMKLKYRVLGFDPSAKSLKILREDFLDGVCSPVFVDTSLDSELFEYGLGYVDIKLVYGCPDSTNYPPIFSCTVNGTADKGVYIEPDVPVVCAKSVVVPVLATRYKDIGNLSRIEDVIKEGFDVKWKEDPACIACTGSKGVCGYDQITTQTTCYYPNQSNGLQISPAKAPQAPSSKSGM
ncbi:LEAF RUST 10 DISEASE-RESISTANCE LOCUS RECEPTOR-LIKE PROTEIN KINASE-like 2.7 [Corylus avellana]|uniref:LEAF RUST 10 DISEASE-RESISTANCE LOCUS RECEPTOR-LIKE PROTEIN KINASE-like 2.7 n=1 Tax=Corylus avellana TaxID=13451 RepID=UPI00286B5613|nr:LEAF RUST 10 DISEASE-RESISTANCE LOCUS RECEPTOR-LIKE PROTEIN KINASE-like 2.7 [Corylus avellana]